MSRNPNIKLSRLKKTQPDTSALHVSRPLGNVSIQYTNEATDYVADKVFPFIGSSKKSDSYYKYKKGFRFRNAVKKRGAGAQSAGIGYELETDNFTCEVYAVHADIHDQDRGNVDEALAPLEQEAAEMVTDQHLLNKDLLFKTNFMTTGVWGKDVAGASSGVAGTSVTYWSTSASADPTDDVLYYQDYVKQRTGKRPRHAVIGSVLLRVLKKNASIIDRIKYSTGNPANPTMVSLQTLAQLWELEEIYVADAVYDDTNEKVTDAPNMDYIFGDEMLLFYKPPRPGKKTISAGYTFGWTGYMGAMSQNAMRMKQFYMDEIEATRVEGATGFVQKAVCVDAAVYFSNLIE